jgi:hypothetical protein
MSHYVTLCHIFRTFSCGGRNASGVGFERVQRQITAMSEVRTTRSDSLSNCLYMLILFFLFLPLCIDFISFCLFALGLLGFYFVQTF